MVCLIIVKNRTIYVSYIYINNQSHVEMNVTYVIGYVVNVFDCRLTIILEFIMGHVIGVMHIFYEI